MSAPNHAEPVGDGWIDADTGKIETNEEPVEVDVGLAGGQDMTSIGTFIFGAVLGAWACAAVQRAMASPGPRYHVIGSQRYMDAVQRDRNESYGTRHQEAMEAAQAAQRMTRVGKEQGDASH